MENKLVSVIIPVYRTTAPLLRKCLGSLICQSYSNLEILVVDDGSPDRDYSELSKEYEFDSRVKFLRKENGGTSSARNFGITHATGTYISFVDSDDFVESNFVYEMYKAIQDCDISICGVTETEYPVPGRWADKRIFFSLPLEFNWLAYMNFCVNKLYKADIIRHNNLRFPEDVKLGEDALFLEQYYRHCESMRSIGSRLYHYVPVLGSAIHSYNPGFWTWENRVIEVQWNLFHTYPLSPRQERCCLHWLYWKLRDSIYYYLTYEKDKDKLEKHLTEIIRFPLYQHMQEHAQDFVEVLPKTERKLLKRWRRNKIPGIVRGYKIEKFKKLIRI